MTPLHAAIALTPLAVYLLAIGWLNLARRPRVVRGSRDLAALALALCGMVVVGPMELFFPEMAAQKFGWLVWPLLLTLYGLATIMLAMISRQRLVVFNINWKEMQPILRQVAAELDPAAEWAGTSLHLPSLSIQFSADVTPLRNVQLVANRNRQSLEGWHEFERALTARLRSHAVSPSPHGAIMCVMGALILLSASYRLLTAPNEVIVAMEQMLRLI